MTIKVGKELIDGFIDYALVSDDHYFVVHFSRDEDKYRVYHNIDAGDALIIIDDLIRKFNLSREAIVGIKN